MRILITGANGQLGMELPPVLKGHTLIPLSLPGFDLLKPDAEQQVVGARPDVIIHTAAYTDVEGAEREPDTAMAVNAEGTERMAAAAVRCGARLLCLSTDYVFDGTKRAPYEETDRPHALNAYGRSKLEGERRALARCPATLVVRTSWLYGLHGKNFVKTILERAGREPELPVVADQQGSPTHAGDLAAALARVLAVDLKGVVHAAGTGSCSWYEFASAIVALAGLPVRLRPISTAESPSRVNRPPYSVLANRVLAERGITLPHWQDALTRFMKERTANSQQPIILRS